MGSLMIFELHLHRRKKERKKFEVTFKAKDVEEDEEFEGDVDIFRLTKQF